MANLEKLIAALNAVSDAYQPDPDDTDDLNDDDGDPNGDPRSYYPDDADKENAEDEVEETDFRSRKPLGMVVLLERLEQQAQFKTDQDWSLVARQRRIPPVPSKLEQKSIKLLQMRRQAAEAEHEVQLNRKLEAETLRLQQARVELYRGNQTAADRMQLEADTDRMADWASRYCKEAGSDWREQAAAAFGSQYLPPVDGQSPKKL